MNNVEKEDLNEGDLITEKLVKGEEYEKNNKKKLRSKKKKQCLTNGFFICRKAYRIL